MYAGIEHQRYCTECDYICDGIHDGALYINGWWMTSYQLVEYDGAIYFITDGHKVAKDTKIYLSESLIKGATDLNGNKFVPGWFEFDANGKLVNAPVWKHGVVDGYLYIDNVMQKAYKLVAFGDDYYFINDGHKIAKETKLYLNAKFLEGTDYEGLVGWYEFDADGKLVKETAPEWRNGVYNGYLYIDNVMQKAYQLVEFDNHVYFVYDGHKVATNTTLYLTQKFVEGKTFNGEPIAVGWYEFDANGWMIIE